MVISPLLLYVVNHPYKAAALAILALLTWLGWYPVRRWRCRTLPGPFGLPFLGNLPGLAAGDATEYINNCIRRYGSVLKIWFGTRPWVVIADPALVRKLAFRITARPSSMGEYGHVLVGHNHEVDQASAFVASGEVWRRGRRVFEASVIHPVSLAAHMPAINRCADRFVARLARRAAAGTAAPAAAKTKAAAGKAGKAKAEAIGDCGGGDGRSGDAAAALDMLSEVGNYTMAAVGEVAYGIDFGTTDDDACPGGGGGGGGRGSDQSAAGRQLIEACTAVFRYLLIENATLYLPLQVIFPSFRPAIRWLAKHFPDAAQAGNMAARSAVAAASRQLMEAWQESKAAEATVAAAVGAEAKGAAASAGAAAGGGGGGGGGGFRSVGAGISGSSFMAAMMEGRRGAKSWDERLSDTEVIAQGFTFMLAGFETTADTLATAVFLLSTHPAAAARLAVEVDSLGGRELTPDLLAELPYTEAVLQETLRLYPPLPFLMREAKEDVDLGGGRVVPKGSFMVLHIHSMQTSGELFPQADRFLPERWLPEGAGALGPADPNAYAPFGVGARMCVGYKLATMVAKAALVRMYQRFDIALHPRQPLPLRMKTGLSRAPADGVWVSLRERSGRTSGAAALAAAAGA